jgi:hypothetical protein
LAVDSQNPTGFVGSFILAPVLSDLTNIHGTALTETPGQLAARFINFFDQDAASFNIKTALSAFKATGYAETGDEMTLEDGAITAAKIAANAIENTKIKDGAISNTKLASATISNSKFAAGAITSGVIADEAIDADSLKADAITKIQAGVWAKTMTELVAMPGATASLEDALTILFMALRNEQVQNSGTGIQSISNNAGTPIADAALTDSGGVFTKAKYT